MCSYHFEKPAHEQKGPNNSAAHESVRAVARSLFLHFGQKAGRERCNRALRSMGVAYTSELNEVDANALRKFLEAQLPPCVEV